MDWETILSNLVDLLLSTGVKIFVALVILIVGWKLINTITRKFENSKKISNVDLTFRTFFRSFFSIGLKILLVVTVVAYLGVPMTSITAMIASCGVAIGLALQGGLSNLAGGVILVFMKPFKIGDFITAAGESGTVKDIGIFYTSLCTTDNRHVYIPNGNLTGGVIVNVSAEETRRIDLSYTVAYESDLDKVKEILYALAEEDDRILKDPASAVVLSSYKDSAIEFTLRVWCKSCDYWAIHGEIQEKVKKAFDREGIQIPFPQLDVHMK